MAKRSRFDWQRSHVIVTGGSQRIGAAVARAARARGATVSVIARGEEQLRATAEPIGAAWACADVTNPAARCTPRARCCPGWCPVGAATSC